MLRGLVSLLRHLCVWLWLLYKSLSIAPFFTGQAGNGKCDWALNNQDDGYDGKEGVLGEGMGISVIRTGGIHLQMGHTVKSTGMGNGVNVNIACKHSHPYKESS